MFEGAVEEQELEQLEISIELARKKVALADALQNLMKNKDFKILFLDEFLDKYAVHLVKNKASYGMQDEDNQKFIDAQLSAIGHVDQFLRFVQMEGARAKEAIRADEETREEILSESN